MKSTLAALCATSFIGVCFMARIPIPEKVPKYSLSNIRGLPNIRGQPPEGPWEVPVFDHPPVFDNEDGMFEGGPPPLPEERKYPEEYDFPDDDFGKFPVTDFNINDIDREEFDDRVDEIPKEKPKPVDEEDDDKGEEIPVEDDEVSKDAEEEDDKVEEIPVEDDEVSKDDEDLDKEVTEDVDEDHKVGPETDLEEEVPPHPDGLISPFLDIDQVRRFFDQVERAMDKVFRQTIQDAVSLNGTVTNTTEEEVDIDGHKYKVVKSIIKSGDYNSSIFIEAVETTLESNRTKRSNWYSEVAQTTNDSDP